jgi:6-phosphofructokinase
MTGQRILIAQGGGPTAVINQSLVGAVLAARGLPQVDAVYGARHGVRGIVSEDLVDLGQETTAHLERVAATPGSALGSTRDKPDLKYCQEILRVLAAHRIGHFFYIGGNDSSDTVRIVVEEARKAGHALAAVHIPKTIDNDLMGNDHTPGFPSAARFVVQAFAGADLDNTALPGVYVAVVMGRHAGFLTAAAALARTRPDDGPHLVYLPERVFDIDRFLVDVKAVHERLGRCVVAVSEGIHDAAGEPVAVVVGDALHLVLRAQHHAHALVQLGRARCRGCAGGRWWPGRRPARPGRPSGWPRTSGAACRACRARACPRGTGTRRRASGCGARRPPCWPPSAC